MGDSNLLSAYKLINSQVVMSNQKLKEEIREKIEMINEIHDELFQCRAENKTLRDMVQKLLEQFKTVTTIMMSVRDQSENVFDMVNREHVAIEREQQNRRPVAALVYEKRRAENPPHEHEAVITEEEEENRSMEDYRTALSLEEDEAETDVDADETIEPRVTLKLTSLSPPQLNRLSHPRRSRNRSIDESFETIDTNSVVAVGRRSQSRDSRGGGRTSEEESSTEVHEAEPMDISGSVVVPPTITVVSPVAIQVDPSNVTNSTLEASSFMDPSGIPSDQSTQSELNPETDQSLRPTKIKRMASDSMICSLVDREANKENSTTINDDTIANASCSTPVMKHRNLRGKKRQPPISPVPMVSLTPLTKANLLQHNISCDGLLAVPNGSARNVKKELDRSDQDSMDSNDSKRPRRKAAPKVLKEPTLNKKLRR
uniref:Shugoshin C-terminal domain-containing protein n=1 Tax=Culex tarsalis TaxID=7177 RepID=A0A1Q3EW66_CULTA